MNTIDSKQMACLEGFIAECAREDELSRSATGMRLLEAQRALDNCSDPVELVAVRHWYHAAWHAYAGFRGWVTPDTVVVADPAVIAA